MNQSFNIKRDIFQSVHFFSFVTKFTFHCNVKLWIKKKLFIPFSIRYFSTHCVVWVLKGVFKIEGKKVWSFSLCPEMQRKIFIIMWIMCEKFHTFFYFSFFYGFPYTADCQAWYFWSTASLRWAGLAPTSPCDVTSSGQNTNHPPPDVIRNF